MASRVVLQMDQATSTHQVILWHIGERGQESDLDCGDGVRTGGGGQEATGHLGGPLHNFADFESYSVRENAYFQAIFRHRLQFIEC